MVNLNDGIHYNWEKTLSYSADITMVVGAPNKGKTFGLRAYALNRAIKKGRRFVEVCRTLDERDAVKKGYFAKLAQTDDEFGRYEYRCDANEFKYRELDAPKGASWTTCGYVVGFAEMQGAKKRTFTNVENIIFDEAIIERIDASHGYKREEWNMLSRIIDSCVREDAYDYSRVKPRLFLLGNAVDLLNPYFAVFGVKGVPRYGYTWYKDKMCLLHYVEPDEHDEHRMRNTLAGRMGLATGYTKHTYSNDFAEDERYIAKKPARAKFFMGCVHLGSEYGIWCDMTEGFYYVAGKIPNNAPNVFALTRKDDMPNRIAAQRACKALRMIVQMYYEGSVLFESVRVREGFLDAMSLYGVR